MKKVKLLVLPLVGLLLSSCASTIKGSELPELTANPGYLLKMKITESGSGDKELLEQLHFSEEKHETTIEFYNNFIFANSVHTEDNKKISVVVYYMLKNKVNYFLYDDDGEKSKEEASDPNGELFKSQSNELRASALYYVNTAQHIYEEMVNVENLRKEADENTTFKLKQLGSIYTLTQTSEEDGEKTKTVYKLKIKNNYFASLEGFQEFSKDNKKATIKMGLNFTFGPEELTYDESKMPNPAHYAEA